jgi:competence protein ComEC
MAAALLLPLAIAAKRSRMFALGSFLFFSGALIAALHRPSAPPQIDAGARETVTLNGCVVEPPAFYDGRDQFTVELAPKARARVTLAIKEGDLPPELHYGQRVEFEARIRAIRNFQNPGAFDSEGFLARSGIYWTASVSAGTAIAVQRGKCGSRFYAIVFALRTAILDRIDLLYRNNPYATGIMEATLIGEKRKLEKIWTDHFRRTGTYHMLVIDGLHVSVLAAVLLFLLRVCFVPQLAALSATAGFAWLYALLSGMDAPAVRAAGGFTCYLIARYFYRRARILNLLAAIAIVYLIYDPDQLFEAGFQLSFLCVAAIGAFALPSLEATSAPLVRGLHGINEVSRDPRLPPRVAHFRLELRLIAETFFYLIRIPQSWIAHFLSFGARLVFFAWEMAVISTVIQIALALPMAIYFHRIPLTGVSANIIVVPLLSLVIPIGFLAVFTNSSFAATIAEWLLNTGETVADWHTGWEPNWRVADPPWWLSIAFSIALLALAMAIPRSRRFTVAASLTVAALFALVFWQPFPANTQPGILELTAIDVGQGDSLLVSFPDGKLMLVDGGGVLAFGRQSKPRLDIGEDVVSPYLWSRSIRRLDAIALTHAHDDHAAGLPALIENFHPAELWTGATPMSDVWSTIAAKARDQRVPVVPMRAGRNFDFGGTRIEILSPPSDYIPAAGPKNNDSLVMRITYGERSILLTGDMEKPMEIGLLADGVPVRADILKVGHHGSNTSSIDLFLDAVSPTYALISDGFENSFRHPHPQVLARLAAHKAGVLRTDRHGLITVRTDGHRIWTETYLPRQASHHPYPHALGLLP